MRLTVSVNKAFCDRDPAAFDFVTGGAWKRLQSEPENVTSGENTELQNECVFTLREDTDKTDILAAFSASLREYKACLLEGHINKMIPGIGVKMAESGESVDNAGKRLSTDPEEVHIMIGLSDPSLD